MNRAEAFKIIHQQTVKEDPEVKYEQITERLADLSDDQLRLIGRSMQDGCILIHHEASCESARAMALLIQTNTWPMMFTLIGPKGYIKLTGHEVQHLMYTFTSPGILDLLDIVQTIDVVADTIQKNKEAQA